MVKDGIEKRLLETASDIRRISTGITCQTAQTGFMRSQMRHTKHVHTEVGFGVFVPNAVTMVNGYALTPLPHTDHLSFFKENLSTTMMMALQKEVGPVTGVLEVLMIDGHNTIIGNKLILTLELHHPVQDRLYIVGVTVYLLKTHHLLVLMLNFHFMTK
jgi:hypothetical protein